MSKRRYDRNPCDKNGHRRRLLVARVKAEGRECALCHRPIDLELPAGNDWAFELDEIVPRWQGGDPLAYDNVQPSHRWCNRQKAIRQMKERARRQGKAEKLGAKQKTKTAPATNISF